MAHWLRQSKRAPGSVKLRAGGDSPRPGYGAQAPGRLTRWNPGTDGESPDGRRTLAARGVARRVAAFAQPRTPEPVEDGPEEAKPRMFTGIVEELGEVAGVERLDGAARLTVRGP